MNLNIHPNLLDPLAARLSGRIGSHWSQPGAEGYYLVVADEVVLTVGLRPDYDSDDDALAEAEDEARVLLGAAADSDDDERQAYIRLAGSIENAVSFEESVLSVGDEFLPDHARLVREGGPGSGAYYKFLTSQFIGSERE